MSSLRVCFLFSLLFASAHAYTQFDPALSEILERAERAPVIVIFDLSNQGFDRIAEPDLEQFEARLALQEAVLERALGRSIAELSAPAAEGSRLRRLYQSVAMVAMVLTEDEIIALQADPSVESVRLDEIVPPTSNNTIPLIGASVLHSAGLTGQGVSTAILDTGVDHEHPMFAGRIIDSVCFSSNVTGSFNSTSFCPGGVEEDTTTQDAGDDCPFNGDSETPVSGCGHGTHVAGIAAGAAFVDPVGGDTLIGVAPGADIVAVQVFSRFTSECGGFGLPSPCTLSWTSDQLAGLDWLFNNRVALNLASANMSLGGGQNFSFCNSDSRFAVINNLRNAGIATAISSGNNGYQDSVGAPGCIEPAITVGATTDADVVAGFSNSATMVDLLAPGVAINSAAPTIDDTLPGRARSISGTSMAAPHVAGAFALLKAAHPNSSVTTLEEALESTGVMIAESPSNLVKPRIRVDLAHAAIDSTNPTMDSIVRLIPAVEFTNAVSLTWRVTFSEPVQNLTVDDFAALGTSGTLAIDNATATTADLTVSGGDLATLDGEVGLALAGGQNIQDLAGNPLTETEPTGAHETYTVDHSTPILESVLRFSPSAQQTDADELIFEVAFSEVVSNVSEDDFTIIGTSATGTLSVIDPETFRMTLTGGDLPNLTGVVGLDVSPGQNITDPFGNALDSAEPAADETYSVVNMATIGGTVTGLLGSGLVLRNNGSEQLAINDNGSFVFTTPVNTGQSYLVDVAAQPVSPWQTCTVINDEGPVTGPDITEVEVNCETNQYAIGGTVTGLLGSGLVLRNNGIDDLAIGQDGPFGFDAAIESGTDYEVTVASDPDNPAQRCSVSNDEGTVEDAPIDNVQIDCRTIIDLEITKVSDIDVLEQGSSVTYVITVTNSSSVAVIDAHVTDMPPPELDDVGWSCDAPAGSLCPASGFDVIDELVTIGPGASIVFTMSAVAAVNDQGVLINVAEVTAPTDMIEDELSNNSATDRLATADIFADRFED